MKLVPHIKIWLSTPDRVDDALLKLVDHFPTFAPTLGEFKKLLREMNVKKVEFFEREALPPPRNKQLGLDAIAKMLASLR